MNKKQRIVDLCQKIDESLAEQSKAQQKTRNSLREIWRIVATELP